jgi:type VI protein secretion system component VasF
MEKQNESMRERLLARLPQPENLAAYREETTSLLTKHEKALFWENRMPSVVLMLIALFILMNGWFWAHKIGAAIDQFTWVWAGFFYFVGIFLGLSYRINRSKVDILKEVKQVQLQILELQASLQKRSSE